jgi:RING finger/CHY zinc finger protein 1
VCQESLRDTRRPASLLPCGHVMHTDCVQRFVQHDYRCPLCKQSIGEMNDMWVRMDALCNSANVQAILEELPPELQQRVVNVLCNDCSAHFETRFSPFNLYKCTSCGGYNTVPK